MEIKKVGILGLGAISNRHIDSILNNKNFKLVSVCDINQKITKSLSKKLSVNGYTELEKMLKNEDLDMVSILTPNSTHYDNMITCIENGVDFLVEKPVTLNKSKLIDVIDLCEKNNINGYCVLQVRYNKTLELLSNVINKKLLGDIRSVSLVLRWQRPIEYFTGWRALSDVGGGTLHEIGIHYLDVLQNIFGKPEIISSSCFNTKHRGVDMEDTIYGLLNFNGKFGGNFEITISAEPNNLECSITVLGSNGFLKIGGKALNVIESYNFLSYKSKLDFEYLLSETEIDNKPNNYGSYEGSCPNHELIYKKISEGSPITLKDSFNVIDMIEDIYNKSSYHNCKNPLL